MILYLQGLSDSLVISFFFAFFFLVETKALAKITSMQKHHVQQWSEEVVSL